MKPGHSLREEKWKELEQKAVSGTILTLLLLNMLTFSFTIHPVESEPKTITVPDEYLTIQEAINHATSGDTIFVKSRTYNEHVIVNKPVSLIGENKDTTIVDGTGTGTVIRIVSSNVRVINFTVRNAGIIGGGGFPSCCILLTNIMHAHIENNTVSNAVVGIFGWASTNITVRRNLVYNCGLMGIHLDGGSSQCTITENIVTKNLEGIEIERSSKNVIEANSMLNNNASLVFNQCGILNVFRRNNMTSSQYNLIVRGYTLDSFMQDMDDSNIANNKVVYYLTNLHDAVVNPSAYPNLGFLAVVNCTNVTVRDFNVTRNGDGMLWAYSTNCTLKNIVLSGNRGLLPWGGLTFYQSSNNTITQNKLEANNYAVCLYHSDGNIFYHNSFIHNNRQVFSDFLTPFSDESCGYYSLNIWDDGYPSGGNFWSDYTGNDLYSGLSQDEIGSDGIGDTPYIIDDSNRDQYPLMNPWTPTPSVEATVEIHPCALNLRSKGQWITAFIELPQGFNVKDICVSTIKLNDTISAELKPKAIGDYDNDGISDLMVKFERSAVISYILRVTETSTGFSAITLTMKGELEDGTQFQGSFTIKTVYMMPMCKKSIPWL